jgi:FMN-dependent NADH-azoreductase
MSKLLFVKSSILGQDSKSAAVAEEFIASWRGKHPGATVTVRDLGASPVAHLELGHLAAVTTPAEKRTSAQVESVALGDSLIDEVEAADTIVIASPMYNFSISSNLKAWIDHVVRAGRTFRYTEEGKPEGLLKNKKVLIVTGRGGIYSEGPFSTLDFQEPYLRAVLGFIGLTNVSFVHVEGQRISPEAAAQGLAKARAEVASLLPERRAA